MQEGTKLVCRKTLIHIIKGKAYRRQRKAPKRRKNITVRRDPVSSFLCVRRPFAAPTQFSQGLFLAWELISSLSLPL